MWTTPSSKILLQYKFHKAIALAWISNDYNINNNKKRKSDFIISSISSSSSALWSQQRAPTISDQTLDPCDGVLHDRLCDDIQHFLIISDNKLFHSISSVKS